jgi:hypothetical protein
VFAGDLESRPAIWQSKSFRDGIGDSQKEQIRKSLKTAIQNVSPSAWVLCLNVDMDSKTHRWFQRLAKSYESEFKVKIGLLDASNIVNELLHRKTIQEHFFPGASINIVELKRMAARTDTMSLAELEQVTDANVEDIIERWKERDARFNYQFVFDTDLGPPPLDAPIPSGLVATVSTGSKKVNIYARDVEALKSNPVTFTISVKGSGIEKFKSLLKTGAAQEFSADELGPIKTNWALVSPVMNIAGDQKLVVKPSPALTQRRRSVRVVFRKSAEESIQYNLMEMRPVRVGREELEFSISSPQVPFELSFVVPIPMNGTVEFTFHYDDNRQRDFREIKKSFDASNLLRPSGQIEVIDLETEKPFLTATGELKAETPTQTGYRELVNDLVAIEDRFKLNLKVPDTLANEDFVTITLLKAYLENGTIEINDFSLTIVKSEENKESLPELLASGKGVFAIPRPQHDPPPKLFGTTVFTGPVTVVAEAEVKDLPATLEAFRQAAIGHGVKISLRPLAPARLSLNSEGIK